MTLTRFGAPVFLALTMVLSACGGGQNFSVPVPVHNTTPVVPQPGPLALISAAQDVAVPSNNGISGVVTVPAGTGTVNVAVSATPPTGTVAIQSAKRSAAAAHTQSSAADSALVYIELSSSASATVNGVPGFTLTLASPPATGSVFEALWNGAQWITVGKAGTVSGNTVTLAGSTTAQTVLPGAPLFVVAYAGVTLPGVQTNVIVDGGFETEGTAGAFAGATNGWAACSYAHVDPSPELPSPSPADPSPVATLVPTIATANVTANLVSSASKSFTVGATPKPNPSASPPAAPPTPLPTIAPAIHGGSFAALTYTGTGANASFAKSQTGANGLCQTFVVPVGATLTMFVNEGGNESSGFGDQEATLFVGGLSALAAAAPAPISLFNELNASVPKATSSPAAYVQKGPFALTEAPPMGFGITPGTTVTLFVGTFDDGPSNKFGEYMFVDDVSVMGFLPLPGTPGGTTLLQSRSFIR